MTTLKKLLIATTFYFGLTSASAASAYEEIYDEFDEPEFGVIIVFMRPDYIRPEEAAEMSATILPFKFDILTEINKATEAKDKFFQRAHAETTISFSRTIADDHDGALLKEPCAIDTRQPGLYEFHPTFSCIKKGERDQLHSKLVAYIEMRNLGVDYDLCLPEYELMFQERRNRCLRFARDELSWLRESLDHLNSRFEKTRRESPYFSLKDIYFKSLREQMCINNACRPNKPNKEDFYENVMNPFNSFTGPSHVLWIKDHAERQFKELMRLFMDITAFSDSVEVAVQRAGESYWWRNVYLRILKDSSSDVKP